MTLTKIIYFLLINDFIKGQVHTRHTATQKHKHTFKKGKEKLVNKTKKKRQQKKTKCANKKKCATESGKPDKYIINELFAINIYQ